MPLVSGPAANADLAAAGKTAADQSLAKAPGDGLVSGNNASASGQQGQHAVALDPAFQITKENGAQAALSQKLVDAQVAFSARIAERAGTTATVNLRDAEEAIAASRFDAARPAANTGVDPQTALAGKKADPANLPATPAAKTAPPAQAAADSQTSSDANADSDRNSQQRDTDIPGASRTDSGPETAAMAPQTAQTIQSNLAAPAPAAGDPAGVRVPGPVKATTAASGAPQLPEPQGEPEVRAGESVHNISLRLTNADQSSVQVRLTERAGELQVSVRTPDVSLTRGLRDGLPDLMSRLQVNGYRAETWQPGGNGNSAGQDHSQEAPSQGHSQQRNGNGSGSQGEQQSNQQQDEQTPKWVRELESSIQRSNNPWPVSPAR